MAPTGRRRTFAIASAAPASCISRCYRGLRCGSRAARWTLRWSAHWWCSCSNERCGSERCRRHAHLAGRRHDRPAQRLYRLERLGASVGEIDLNRPLYALQIGTLKRIIDNCVTWGTPATLHRLPPLPRPDRLDEQLGISVRHSLT